jgi:hypothetical protein
VPLPTADFISWLTNLGWDTTQEYGFPILPGAYVPDEPDKVVIATPVPGPGYLLEAAADGGAFQLRTRGGQLDQAGAEAAAYRLDALILGASFPARTASGQVIIHIHRLGGQPALLGPPDDGGRYEYVQTVLAIASVPVS